MSRHTYSTSGAASVCCLVNTMAPSGSSLGPFLLVFWAPSLRAAASSMGITVDTVRWLAEEKMPILNVSCAQHRLALGLRHTCVVADTHNASSCD